MFKIFFFVLLLRDGISLEFQYHTHVNLTIYLQSLAEKYSNNIHLYSIGFSTEGRDLWAVAVSADSPNYHKVSRPEVKLVGNIHGSEVCPSELHFEQTPSFAGKMGKGGAV